MSDQPILCEVSEVIFRVSNRRASVNLRLLGVVNVARCNCVSNVCASAIDVVVQTLSRSGLMFKSLCIGDLQRPIHIIPSFAANLANHGRNLANWSLNLAISDANLASESSYLLGIMAICEVSEVISLPSHVRTRTRTRAGETVFQYRSGRKITSHNLVTSQLGSTVGGRSITDASSTSDQRTTLHHIARFLPSRPTRRSSRSTRQWPNSGPHGASKDCPPADGSSPETDRALGPREQPRYSTQFVCFVRPPTP
jgi:hypothetical protein